MTLAFEVDQLNRMFDAAFSGEPLPYAGWVPAVDIFETESKDLVLKADLPDLKREDIKLTYENNVLSIEGDRTPAGGPARDSFHRAERGHGAFRRSFTLPPTIDAARIEASYEAGVLTVKLPRREETRARSIQIGVNG